MFSIYGHRNGRRGAIEAELDGIRHEIARLAGRASRLGEHAYGDTREWTHDFYDEVSERMSRFLPTARRGVRQAERVVRDNPGATAAVVGLVVIGLVASILYSRK